MWVLKMVLYPLLPAKALCVIIKFEICNSDSRVKQANVFSFFKAEATRSFGSTKGCYLSLFSRILEQLSLVCKYSIEVIIVIIIMVNSQ